MNARAEELANLIASAQTADAAAAKPKNLAERQDPVRGIFRRGVDARRHDLWHQAAVVRILSAPAGDLRARAAAHILETLPNAGDASFSTDFLREVALAEPSEAAERVIPRLHEIIPALKKALAYAEGLRADLLP